MTTSVLTLVVGVLAIILLMILNIKLSKLTKEEEPSSIKWEIVTACLRAIITILILLILKVGL